MAKGNAKARDMAGVNKSYDTILTALEGMSDHTKELMPLVADSLDLTRKLVKLYRDAFNQGLKK